MFKRITSIFLIAIFIFACKKTADNPSKESIPVEIAGLENLNIYSLESEADTVLLTKDQILGNTDDVYYPAINKFAVDDAGRVYIINGRRDIGALHIYNPDGTYLNKIAEIGRGPGEFLQISSIHYQDNNLLLYDSELKRVSLFSTNPIELLKTVNLNPKKWEIDDSLKSNHYLHFLLLNEKEILIGFEYPPHPDREQKREIKYFKFDDDLNMNSEINITGKSVKTIWEENFSRRGNTLTKAFKVYPFFERSLAAISNDNHIYTAETGEFLIKKFNSDGQYLSSFYYPTEKIPVMREHAMSSSRSSTEELDENVELPDYWPVLNQMYMDDKNRFWISTITKEDDHFQWYVLKENGELLAKFKWPGDKTVFQGKRVTLNIIKGDYFYTLEENGRTGEDEIVRYRIEFKDL